MHHLSFRGMMESDTILHALWHNAEATLNSKPFSVYALRKQLN